MTLTSEYDRLYIDKQSPDAYRSMSAVASAVAHTAEAAGLGQLFVELVDIRISQLNGCGFCLDLHVRRAVENGESRSASPSSPRGATSTCSRRRSRRPWPSPRPSRCCRITTRGGASGAARASS